MSPAVSVRLLLTQSDARLVAFARAGHERAFEALVQRYRRPLHNYCRRLLLSDERAEDALQQALLQAWLALRAGTEVGDVKPWLYRIVHNAAVNALRVSGYDYCKLNESLSGAGAPQEDLDRRIAVREALAGLAALPEMQREALLRTAVEGRTHQQVARDLGLSENALRGLVYRARSTLRAAAGAITPSPLVSWALGATRGTPVVERLAELGAGGGSAGLAGLLMKGGAVAVTASVLAGGMVTGHHGHKSAAKRTAARASHSTVAPVAVASAQPARWSAGANAISTRGGSPQTQTRSPRATRFTHHPNHRGRWIATPSPTTPRDVWLGGPHRDGGSTHDSGSKDGHEGSGNITHRGDTSGGGGDSHSGKDGGSSVSGGETREGTSSSLTGEHDGEHSGERTGSGETASGDGASGSDTPQTDTGSGGSTSTNEPSKDEKTTTTAEETVKHD
jgi:RNA polymerase sigma factor (sigma-70 family)